MCFESCDIPADACSLNIVDFCITRSEIQTTDVYNAAEIIEIKYLEQILYSRHFGTYKQTKYKVTVYRGLLISGGWNRGVPLYTEVSSFQVVRIEEFHCIQRCPHFRGLE